MWACFLVLTIAGIRGTLSQYSSGSTFSVSLSTKDVVPVCQILPVPNAPATFPEFPVLLTQQMVVTSTGNKGTVSCVAGLTDGSNSFFFTYRPNNGHILVYYPGSDPMKMAHPGMVACSDGTSCATQTFNFAGLANSTQGTGCPAGTIIPDAQ